MRLIWLLLSATVLTAGCLDGFAVVPGASGGPVEERPAEWASGAEMEAHSTARYHSGGFDARVFPQGDLERPDRCVAYRGNEAFAGDTCLIMEPDSEHWHPVEDRPWGLKAKWQGRLADTADRADPERPRTVVAFLGDEAIAYWDGAAHPEARHATE